MVFTNGEINRKRWLLHLVAKSLSFRKGRSLLLLLVLVMASSLVTSLGIVSSSMGKRVDEEVKKYGANLVIIPDTARIDVGSGGLNFGIISDPAFLDQNQVVQSLKERGAGISGHSFHLRGTLKREGIDVPVEGVNFPEIRRLFPWWQVRGAWPKAEEAVIGSDLAAKLSLKIGDVLRLAGAAGELEARVTGVVTTGGEEDKLLFVDLRSLQGALGLDGRLTLVRLITSTGGESLKRVAADLQVGISGGSVREVRQVARTSEALLKKVRLLMALVTAVVVIASGGSVAGTMSTTVLERGKEIGLMKAVGGKRWEVLLIFAAEALLLGIIGGLAGFLVGNLIAIIVASTVFSAPPEFLPWFLPLSIAASLLLALIGSLGPMFSVFHLDPVKSLRGE